MPLSLLLIRFLLLFLLTLVQEDGLTLTAEAGFDGLYEPMTTVPVVVSARNDGAPFEGEIRVFASATAGSSGLVYSAPITLPTGADKRVPLTLYVEPFSGGNLVVQLVSDGVAVAETRTNRLNTVNRNELFYGVISPDPGGLAFLETVPGRRTDAAVAYLQLADLPEVSSAWDALDILIIDDTDTGRLTAAQRAALHAWLESGGQLVVTGGAGGAKTAAGVADLLPVSVSGATSLVDLPALSEAAGEPLGAIGPYVVTTSVLGEGKVWLEQDGLPLVASRAVGRGAVTFLALDPKAAPLSGWPGAEVIWSRVAAGTPDGLPWGQGINDGYAAAQSVSYISGLSLPSFWQLFFFLFIYILIIGPIHFLVLRRLNRRELAWITTPALVLLFSALTFFTGFRTRGSGPTLNMMSIAFGAADAERLQTQSVIGLYSPRRARYDLTLPYDASAFPFQQGFGTLVSSGNLDAIVRAGEVTLSQVRTDTSEVATFIVNAHLPRPSVTATATLSAEGDAVDVIVRNDSGQTLENAIILHGQKQSSLGDVAPGEERTLSIPLPTGPTGASPTPDPMFPSSVIDLNPLLTDPAVILGTIDYYSDPEAYPRWQLIQSQYTGETIEGIEVPSPTESVTLGGWLASGIQPVNISTDDLTQTGATLLLLEIPVQQAP
ncbi:MAG: hypothetical protein KA586_08590 [Candidatus Promineofilum sp.]|nr:hypothetical protein [Promineifilum sp.]